MARSKLSDLKKALVAIAVIAAVAGGIAGAVIANSPGHKVGTMYNAQSRITDISYKGQNGVDALTLLKKHAQVQVKHYSFGDLVTAIDGNPGTGPKYWTFYINGKEASVGASAYISKNTDNLEWKLQ